MFSAAKSSVSEDISMVGESLMKYGLGTVETVSGAAGGVRFRPFAEQEKKLKEAVYSATIRMECPAAKELHTKYYEEMKALRENNK